MSDAHVFADRLTRAQAAAGAAGVDVLLITPGPSLRYLTGYEAKPLERLTCLVLPTLGTPTLVVPELEILAALASPVAELQSRTGLDLRSWSETQDGITVAAELVSSGMRVALDDRMWAEKALRFRAALPGCEQRAAGGILGPLRMRKDAAEVRALRDAGEAIDAVHANMGQWLRPGRTEREAGRDIAEAILDSGHVSVDFVIVASGPNGASPHHEVSDRVMEAGDAIVVDIGGTMPSGYCSDSTRMYALGDPGTQYRERYAVLEEAQQAARTAVRVGASAASIDAAARTVLAEAGLGPLFIHRTGHGIGLETHEDPYIVEGNDLVLEEGMAFSIEPGFYEAGRHGARIEDIVVCGAQGADVLNLRPRDLVILPT